MTEKSSRISGADRMAEPVPMHPEDFIALLAWVRAKDCAGRKRDQGAKT